MSMTREGSMIDEEVESEAETHEMVRNTPSPITTKPREGQVEATTVRTDRPEKLNTSQMNEDAWDVFGSDSDDDDSVRNVVTANWPQEFSALLGDGHQQPQPPGS